jgi:hypothetical protein
LLAEQFFKSQARRVPFRAQVPGGHCARFWPGGQRRATPPIELYLQLGFLGSRLAAATGITIAAKSVAVTIATRAANINIRVIMFTVNCSCMRGDRAEQRQRIRAINNFAICWIAFVSSAVIPNVPAHRDRYALAKLTQYPGHNRIDPAQQLARWNAPLDRLWSPLC